MDGIPDEPNTQSNSQSLTSRLGELGRARADGLLTDAEFDAAKARLLSSLDETQAGGMTPTYGTTTERFQNLPRELQLVGGALILAALTILIAVSRDGWSPSIIGPIICASFCGWAGVETFRRASFTMASFAALPLLVAYFSISLEALDALVLGYSDLSVYLAAGMLFGVSALVVVVIAVRLVLERRWFDFLLRPLETSTAGIASILSVVVFFANPWYIDYLGKYGVLINRYSVGERWFSDDFWLSVGSVISLLGAAALPLLAGTLRNRVLGFWLALGSAASLIAIYSDPAWRGLDGSLEMNGYVIVVLLAIAAATALAAFQRNLLAKEGINELMTTSGEN